VTFKTAAGDVEALRDVSFETREREFLSIVGPSGCGKTTLLRVLARLISPRQGRVEYLNRNEGKQGPVLLIFQEKSLFPWMTVLENATFGLAMQGVAKEVRERQALIWLASFGLGGRENSYPSQLSLGMKQRVAIVRAFLSQPSLLLMDEPFAALDYQSRLALQQELLQLWEREHKSVVFVTHDIDEAILLSDRVLVLRRQPGTVIGEYAVRFSRPRSTDLTLHTEFLKLKRTIADLLGLAGTRPESRFSGV